MCYLPEDCDTPWLGYAGLRGAIYHSAFHCERRKYWCQVYHRYFLPLLVVGVFVSSLPPAWIKVKICCVIRIKIQSHLYLTILVRDEMEYL